CGDEVGPLRKIRVKLDLLLAPGQRTREQLAAVGRDRDVARDIAAGERCEDDVTRDDEPCAADRGANGPRNGYDDEGAVTRVHGRPRGAHELGRKSIRIDAPPKSAVSRRGRHLGETTF